MGHLRMRVTEAMWDLWVAGTCAPAFESQREIAGPGWDCLGAPPSTPRHETLSAYYMTLETGFRIFSQALGTEVSLG